MNQPIYLRKRIRMLVLLVIGATAYGTLGYMLLEGWSAIDALYMTITTMATVGFGEVRPLDASGRLFTITLIMLGVGIVLVTISVIAAWIGEEGLGSERRRRRMEKRAAAKDHHFVICAYGRVGRAVARAFEREGIDFIVIDRDEGLEARMQADGVDYLIGDPSQEGLLEAAGVRRAKGVIVAVDDDATNVYITLIARSMKPDLFIVARASDPATPERLQAAGADRIVSPFVSSGQHMAMMATNPSIVDALEVGPKAGQPLWVEEVSVDPTSGLAGKPLSEAVDGSSALAVRHRDGSITTGPASDLVLADGDLLLVLR